MNRLFVTSDTHFGHVNILRYCDRAFGNIEDMNIALIERWNARVGLDDTVFFLGDFAMGPNVNEDFIVETALRLHGNIIAILGNHDKPNKWHKGLKNILEGKWTFMSDSIHELEHDNKKFVLCHFPLQEWNGQDNGVIHLHGHSHTQFNANNMHEMWRLCKYDIGVDMYGGPVEITSDLRYLTNPRGWNV